MQNTSRILVCTFFGALFCGIMAGILFSVGATIDGTRPDEALVYGAVVAILAAFFGAVIGLAVGIANLSWLGGALTGLLATLGVVAFYVLNFGRPNEYGYFLGESAIIVIVLALPAILTGVLTALVKNRLFARP